MFPYSWQEFFSNLGDIGVTVAVLIAVTVWLLVLKQRLLALSMVGSTLVCMGMTGLLKLFFLEQHGMPELGLTDAAPSGHTSINIVTYCGIAGVLLANYGRGTRTASAIFAALGVTIALSRISEYGHSPEDVVFGLFIGGLGAVCIFAMALREQTKFDASMIGVVTLVALLVSWSSGFRFDADAAFHAAAARLLG